MSISIRMVATRALYLPILFISLPTLAQVEEVTVTAQKRTETVQTVAVAVGVMTAEELSEASINSFLSAAAKMPGVSTLGSSIISIRGIGTSSSNIGVEPSTTMMLDGEVMVRANAMNSDLTDLARLEVLRGPQSTLFGKNASAGVIHYISKTPDLEDYEIKATVKVAEDGEYKVNTVINVPLNPRVAYRASGYYSIADGYKKNSYPGNSDGGEQTSYGLRQQFLFAPKDDLQILVRGEFSKKSGNCCGASVVSVDNPDVVVRTSLTNPNQVVNLLDLTHTLVGFDHNTTTRNDLHFSVLENKAASIEINKDFYNNTLTYQGYYRKWDAIGNSDPISNALILYPKYFAGTRIAQSTQHELRLTSSGSQRIDYVLGAAYFNSKVGREAQEQRCVRGDQGTVFDPDTLEVLSCRSDHWANINGDPNAAGGKGKRLPGEDFTFGENGDVLYDFNNSYETSLNALNVALFGQLDLNVTDRLKVTGGLRYLREKTTLQYQGGRSDIENWPNPELDESNKTDETALIGKTAIQFNWTNEMMVYASYARGYKGVGWFNTIGASRARLNHTDSNPNGDNGALKAERPEQYEIGLRSSWMDNHLIANLTAFYIENDSFQERMAILDSDPGSSTFGSFTGDYRNMPIASKGVEVEFVANPMKGLRLKASGAYIDAIYKGGFQKCPVDRFAEDYSDVAPTQEEASLGQCFEAFDTKGKPEPILSLNGMEIANSLKTQFRVSADYKFDITKSGHSLVIHANYRWKGKKQSRSDQRLASITPSVGILDLGVTFRNPSSNWSTTLFSKNVLDTTYYTSFSAQAPWLGGGYKGGTSRNFNRYFGIQTIYSFK